MSNEDYQCPGCGTAIRSTGGAEYLYDDDTDRGKVIGSHVTAFTDFGVGDEREQLWYCPSPIEECRIVRLTPGDSE